VETRKILLNLLVNNLTLIKVIGTRNQIIFLLKSAFESLARSSWEFWKVGRSARRPQIRCSIRAKHIAPGIDRSPHCTIPTLPFPSRCYICSCAEPQLLVGGGWSQTFWMTVLFPRPSTSFAPPRACSRFADLSYYFMVQLSATSWSDLPTQPNVATSHPAPISVLSWWACSPPSRWTLQAISGQSGRMKLREEKRRGERIPCWVSASPFNLGGGGVACPNPRTTTS